MARQRRDARGPEDPRYFYRRREQARKGDPDSALELLEDALRSLKDGSAMREPVRRYVVAALAHIVGRTKSADAALLLVPRAGRPKLDTTERDLRMAIAVWREREADKAKPSSNRRSMRRRSMRRIYNDLALKPAFKRAGCSEASFKRAWETYGSSIKWLTHLELEGLSQK
jgi:hypothetical protein